MVRFVARLLARVFAAGVFVAFAFGYASPFLPPESFWWTGPFAVVLPLSAACMIVLSTASLLRALTQRRRLRAGLSGLVLLLVVLRFGPVWMTPSPDAAPEDALRVMSFNVPYYYTDQKTEADAAIVDLVDREAPDVIALQEAALRIRPRPIAEKSSPRLRAILTNRSAYRTAQHLPDRFSLPQVVVGQIPLDSIRVLDDGLPKQESVTFTAHPVGIRVAFDWKGQRVALYNVHLNSVIVQKPWMDERIDGWLDVVDPSFWIPYVKQYRDGARRRAVQARKLKAWMDAETGPVLVTGDFNGTRHNWAYRHLASGLTDVVTASGDGWTATYPSRWPLFRIDHVLTSEHWTAHRAHVPSVPHVSDHRPVVVDVSLDAR